MPKQKKRSERNFSQPFLIGDWQVDPASGYITHGDESVKLEPLVMDVLIYLATRPGAVVPREEMEATIWQGRVVGYDALTSTMLKLRKALNDDSHHPKFIETVSKRGYRLVADVQPLISIDASAARKKSQTQGVLRTVIGLVAIMLLILSLFLFTNFNNIDTAPPQLRSPATIAVLPFDNLGDDPTQQYFSDGMTDDLITDLTQLSGLHVISRDSVFLYRNEPVSIAQAAAKLNVRYVLHGSVRRTDDRIRINVQLVDTESDMQLWAERYDSDVRDIFSVQDQFADKIVTALRIKLAPAEQDMLRIRPTDSVQAYDAYLRGLEDHFRLTPEDNQSARAHFERAIELDPGFSRAVAGLALVYSREAIDGWTVTPTQSLNRAAKLAETAAHMNPAIPQVHFVSGQIALFRQQHELAIEATQRAIHISPNYADAYALQAWILNYAGRPDEALAKLDIAMRLNPVVPASYSVALGEIHYMKGEYTDAIAAFERALEINPLHMRARMWLAATFAHIGKIEDAQWQVIELTMLSPGFSLARLEYTFPFRDQRIRDRLLHDLHKAGINQL